MFQGHGRVSLRSLGVLWEFQKPEGRQRRDNNNKCVCLCGKRQEENETKRKGQTPEEKFLSSLLFDDVELVVVPQSPGHFLIGHIVSVL